MTITTEYIQLSTQGNAEVVDITADAAQMLQQQDVNNGVVTLCVIGSTGALTTCEYEPGLVKDIPELFDKLIPPGAYHHDQTWHDGNGHSHLRASLVGSSLTLPFKDKELILGTWQQVIFIDFDARPRQRKIVAQIMGE